jgi:hypothetical protein
MSPVCPRAFFHRLGKSPALNFEKKLHNTFARGEEKTFLGKTA